MSNYQIRLYQPEDFEETWRIFRRLSEHYSAHLPTPERTREHVESNILGENSDVQVVLAFDEGGAVGVATFSIMYPVPKLGAQLFIKELFVDADYRGKGVGKQLMVFLANHALDHGCTRLDWACDTDNPEALAFYESLGTQPLDSKVYFRFADEELRAFSESD